MYVDDMVKNDAILQDLEHKYHMAYELCRYRPLRDKKGRTFAAAILAGLIDLFKRQTVDAQTPVFSAPPHP